MPKGTGGYVLPVNGKGVFVVLPAW